MKLLLMSLELDGFLASDFFFLFFLCPDNLIGEVYGSSGVFSASGRILNTYTLMF